MNEVFHPEPNQKRYFRTAILFFLFLFLLAAFLPLASSSAEVIPPEKFLGFQPGQDFKLASWKQITDYFQLLNQSSNRLKLVELGKTTLGRPLVMAIITAEENFTNLEKYKKIQQTLHDPRQLKPEEKASLIKEGKAIVYISCSIHSTSRL
jgi:hypothetical protein